jgi:hypothetical protein
MSLIFPEDLGVNAKSLNYMSFQAFTITGGVGSAKSDRKYEMVGEPVYLPIPVEGVQDQMMNNWGAEDVNFAQMTAAGALQGVGPQGGATSSTGLFQGLQDKVLGIGAEGGLMSSIRSAVMELDTKEMEMVAQRGVAQAGVGLFRAALGNAALQTTGIAGFDETSVAYSGPQFRNFSFSFSLKPITQSEQIMIESIVGFFKEAASPREIEGELYRIYSLPKVFQIKFFNKGGESTSLPKLGKCALRNIGIKYGGDRFQTFATGHAPIQTDISLEFIELVLQTNGSSAGRASTAKAGALGQGGMAGLEPGGMGPNGKAGGNVATRAGAAQNRIMAMSGPQNPEATIARQKADEIAQTNVNA